MKTGKIFPKMLAVLISVAIIFGITPNLALKANGSAAGEELDADEELAANEVWNGFVDLNNFTVTVPHGITLTNWNYGANGVIIVKTGGRLVSIDGTILQVISSAEVKISITHEVGDPWSATAEVTWINGEDGEIAFTAGNGGNIDLSQIGMTTARGTVTIKTNAQIKSQNVTIDGDVIIEKIDLYRGDAGEPVLKVDSLGVKSGALTADGGVVDSNNAYITNGVIIPATGVTLNKNDLSLTVGNAETLTATVSPANATVKSVEWYTYNPSVASVTDGDVTAISAGTTRIEVTIEDGANERHMATCTVEVIAAVEADPPTVTAVLPRGAIVAVNGDVVITFSEKMDSGADGTVQLNGLAALTGGSWSDNDTVFIIPYSGLVNGTDYTVNISGFKDVAGNTMVADGTHSFKTITPAVPGEPITISDVDSVVDIQSAIQAAIDAAASSGGTVTVMGSKTNVTKQLQLNIKAGVTVVWQATYEGGEGLTGAEALINLGISDNVGIFKLTGKISAVNSNGTVYAIDRGASKTDIIIDGGLVSANGTTQSCAIKADGVGGAIRVENGSTITAFGAGINRAFEIFGNDVTVADSAVFAYGGGANQAFYAQSSTPTPAVTVAGGIVLGYGSANASALLNSVTFAPASGAAVILWDGLNKTYDAGDTNGFVVEPNGYTAKWDIAGGKSGVTYIETANRANTGFIPLPVTVNKTAYTYTITFDPKGGSVNPASAQTDTDGKLSSLPTPVRNNYSFDGWFTSETGGTQISTSTIFTANTTVYAQWNYINVPPAHISVTGVTLNKSSTSLNIGDTETLTATVNPSNATNKNVTWATSDSSLATVNDGVVTTASAGTATITVTTADGGFTATCAVTVSAAPTPAVTGVTVSPATAEAQKGTTQQFAATVTGTNNPDTSVTWSVSGNSETGTNINSSGLLTVSVDETAGATLTVTATSTYDTSKFGTAAVTVKDTPPMPTYGISLDVSGTHIFSSAVEGYGAQTPLTVNVTNTGNQPTGSLNMALSGANAGDFTLSKTSITDIAVSGSDSFAVEPKTGLAAGTYTATVTVSGSNITSQSFNVSFTVNSAPNLPTPPVPVSPTITIPSPPNTTADPVTAYDGSAGMTGAGSYAPTATVTYPVTVYGSYAGTTGAGSYAQGDTVTINAGERNGYSFSGWTSSEIILANPYNATGKFTMPANAVTLTAVWSLLNGESVIYTLKGGIVILDLYDGKTDNFIGTLKDRIVTLDLSDDKINKFISKAKDKTVIFDLTGIKEATAAVFDVNAAKAFVNAEVSLTLKLPNAEITLSPDALKKLAAAHNIGTTPITVQAAAVPMKDLTGMQAAQVKGYETVININVFVGNSKTDIPITVSLPYKLKNNEDPAAVCAWHLDGDGNLTKQNSAYSKSTGMITFTVSHQSCFVTGYDPVTLWVNTFSDIPASAWHYDAIAFANYYGLFTGYGDSIMSPQDNMSRAMFATVLYKLESSPTPNGTASFTDIQPGAWYHNPVIWAAENGIFDGIAGIGAGGEYAPNKAITRQEMAVMFLNYASYKGFEIPENRTMPNYADFGQADEWAQNAARMLSEAGVMGGDGVGVPLFSPHKSATRAEAAQMFKNFLRFVGGMESLPVKTAAVYSCTVVNQTRPFNISRNWIKMPNVIMALIPPFIRLNGRKAGMSKGAMSERGQPV